jgi:cytochrome c553
MGGASTVGGIDNQRISYRGRLSRHILVAFILLLSLAGLVFFVMAWRPSIAPIARPAPGSFAADLIKKGEVLAAIGHCAACHTQPGGQPFAGGYALHCTRI